MTGSRGWRLPLLSGRRVYEQRIKSAPSTASPASNLTQFDSDRLWPYSAQYSAIASEGQRRPPPAFGAPAFVWHMGIWQKRISEDLENVDSIVSARNATDIDEIRARNIRVFDEQNVAFFNEISDFLKTLQLRGRRADTPIKELAFVAPQLRSTHQGKRKHLETHSFKVCEPQSLSFTLWWQDQAGFGRENCRQLAPSASDIRVRVQAQTHLDHATISFFVDAGKPWRSPTIYRAEQAIGDRRRAIFGHVESVRAICDKQILGGHVDFDRFSERGVSTDEAKALLDAANYFYVGIWREFIAAFAPDASLEPVGARQGAVGEVFADYRSVLLSVDGLPSPHERARKTSADAIRSSSAPNADRNSGSDADSHIGFGRYRTFDNDVGEPNTMLRAYWPFVRRTTPSADDRDYVACGILDWRMLYISAQSSATETDGEEASSSLPFLPGGWFAEGQNDEVMPDRPRPIRALFLSKGEPHRHQAGRFVERMNAIGTMRLFALKDWATVRNAGVLVRLLGHELDGILSDWSAQRLEIDRDWDLERAKIPPERLRRRRGRRWNVLGLKFGPRLLHVDDTKVQDINDERAERLSELIGVTDSKLISLGAALDSIGQGGSGRLLYVINRSRHFIGEFERMADTLEVGNIDTWINYAQFVDRGLRPTFELIRSTGDRLLSLRDRLQVVTDMIQTSALIVETEATRSNTAILRRIASNWQLITFGVWGILIFTALPMISRLLSIPDVLSFLRRLWPF